MIEQEPHVPSATPERGSLVPSAGETDGWSGIRIAAEPMLTVRCTGCGCALYPDPSPEIEQVWYHFAPARGRDANGCRIACASAAHRADGRPLDRAWA